MEASPGSRCGDIASDIATILMTIAQIIFLTFFHEYIAWYATGPDGSVTRLPMLTDDYFTWLPFPITASILVIVALTATVLYDRHRLRQAAWAVFSILGIVVVVSLVSIFPFDFSVIPNPVAADVVPVVVTVFLIFMAIFYAAAALVQFARIVKRYR